MTVLAEWRVKVLNFLNIMVAKGIGGSWVKRRFRRCHSRRLLLPHNTFPICV